MAFCGKCGKEIDDEAVVCVHCGCPVTSQSSQEAKAETQGLSDKQKKIIAFAFAVVILAGLLAAFWFFVESYDPTGGYEELHKSQEEEIERMEPLRDEISERSKELKKYADELLAEAGSMDY